MSRKVYHKKRHNVLSIVNKKLKILYSNVKEGISQLQCQGRYISIENVMSREGL